MVTDSAIMRRESGTATIDLIQPGSMSFITWHIFGYHFCPGHTFLETHLE